MAYEIPGFSFTLPAGADLSSSLFRAVDVNSSGVAVLPGAGGRIIGFLNNRPKSGEAATIVHSGIVQAECGAAVTRGANVMVGTDGRVLDHVAADDNAKVGIALETGSAAGVVIAVLLTGDLPDASPA